MPAANNGCQLPEELRRYYLEAMGIQLWTEKTDATTETTITGTVNTAPLGVQEACGAGR